MLVFSVYLNVALFVFSSHLIFFGIIIVVSWFEIL